MTTHNNLQIRLKHLENSVNQGLILADKAKREVPEYELVEAKEYFLQRGYPVESIAEIRDSPPFKELTYYLVIGRKPHA